MTDKNLVEKLMRRAWNDRYKGGMVHLARFDGANVGFLIESGGHNEFVAYLSVSKAQKRREREIVRLFFGKRAVKKSRGLFCNLYEGYL